MRHIQISIMNRIVFIAVIIGSFSIFQISLAQEDTAATQHKKTLMQVYEKAINTGELALLDESYAADYVNHGFGDDLDLTGFKAFVSAWRSAMPDFKATPEVIIANADGEWAASRVIFSGTFDKEWVEGDQTIVPNNKPIQLSFHILHRFDDEDKIVEDFTAFDRLSLLNQMDAAPKLPAYISSALVTGDIEPIVLGETVSVGMEQAHKDGYSSIINDSLNKGDLTAIDNYMVDDYLTHEPFGNFSREAFKQVVIFIRTVIPDLHVDMDVTVAEGDWLAGRLIYTGTFGQKIAQDGVAVEATGKPIRFIINVFVRFNQDGIGIADYKEYNRLAWLQQLGILAAPAA